MLCSNLEMAMLPLFKFFVSFSFSMPGRIRKCLNLNCCKLHDPHVTTNLVDFFKSSPAAKGLLKRVVSRVFPGGRVQHARTNQPLKEKSLQPGPCNSFWTSEFQKKRCAVVLLW